MTVLKDYAVRAALCAALSFFLPVPAFAAEGDNDFAITAPGLNQAQDEEVSTVDTAEFDNVPEGLLLSGDKKVEKAPEETGSKLPQLLGEIPGNFKIPGASEETETGDDVLSIEQIMTAYKKGKYDVVMQNLKPMADNRQHAAEELLGVMYMQGQGTKKDPVQALDLLQRAAEANRPLAQHYLGVMYFTGEGMKEPDNIKALMWLHIAILHYGDGPQKERAKKDRDAVYVSMSRLEKSRAIQLARDWLEARGEGHLMDMKE